MFKLKAFIINITELNDPTLRQLLRSRTFCKKLLMVFCKLCYTMWAQYFGVSRPRQNAEEERARRIRSLPPRMACIVYNLTDDAVSIVPKDATLPQDPAPQATASSSSTLGNHHDFPGSASVGASLPGSAQVALDGSVDTRRQLPNRWKSQTQRLRKDYIQSAISPHCLQTAPLIRGGSHQDYGHCAETNPFIT